MSNPFEAGAQKAAQAADRRTADEESKLALPQWDELRKMLPDPQDQQKLDQLVEIVNKDTAHNEKVAALLKNINTLGDVVVKTLGALK